MEEDVGEAGPIDFRSSRTNPAQGVHMLNNLAGGNKEAHKLAALQHTDEWNNDTHAALVTTRKNSTENIGERTHMRLDLESGNRNLASYKSLGWMGQPSDGVGAQLNGVAAWSPGQIRCDCIRLYSGGEKEKRDSWLGPSGPRCSHP